MIIFEPIFEKPTTTTKTQLLLLALLIFIGSALRVAGIFNDLWLDEVWALKVASELTYPLQAFTPQMLDGHTSLYTIILHYLGMGHESWFYRMPALLASLASLLALLILFREWRFAQKSLLLFFYAVGFMPVLYGSEARGYSCALLCMLLALIFIRKRANIYALYFFWLFSLLGFFFHFAFIQFLISISMTLFLVTWKQKGLKAAIQDSVLTFLPIFLTVTFTYITLILKMSPGTGPIGSPVDVLVNCVALMVGIPEISALDPAGSSIILALSVLVLGILLTETIFLIKDKKRWEEGIYYAVSLFLVPVFVIYIINPRVLVPRYLIFSAFFIYPLLASFLLRIAQTSWGGRALAAIVIAGFYLGSFKYHETFFLSGRGEYSKALADITAADDNNVISIAGDQDFRNATMIEYYASKLASNKQFNYVTAEQSLANPPPWYFRQTQDRHLIFPEKIKELDNSYLLFNTYEFTAESGWRWAVYRRVQ